MSEQLQESSQKQKTMNELQYEIVRLFKKRPSVCVLILGRRGTGKTDLGLYFAETLLEFGVIEVAATNIAIHETDLPIDHITNLDDLESWAKNRTGKKMFILDEAGKSLRRRTPMSGLNIALLDNLQILRKYRLSLILITPAEKYIDSATLGSDVLDLVIWKPEFNNPKVGVWVDQMTGENFRWSDIPRTNIKFDTYDVAPFMRNAPQKKPVFKDEDKQFLYEVYSKTKTNLSTAERVRKMRLTEKYMLESLKMEGNK